MGFITNSTVYDLNIVVCLSISLSCFILVFLDNHLYLNCQRKGKYCWAIISNLFFLGPFLKWWFNVLGRILSRLYLGSLLLLPLTMRYTEEIFFVRVFNPQHLIFSKLPARCLKKHFCWIIDIWDYNFIFFTNICPWGYFSLFNID